MPWKQTQSNALRIGRKPNARLSTRVFSSLLFCLVGLSALPSSASADDATNEVVESFESLTLSDLDPDMRSAVVGLATSISGANASQATIDDNVAAILAILQQFSFSSGAASFLRVIPFANANGNTMAAWLANLLGENVNANVYPPQSSSYLYMIQRALYGSSGVPSSADALLPTVWEIADFLPRLTNSTVSDLSFSNALYSTGTQGTYSIADLAAIQAAFFNGMTDPESAGASVENVLADYVTCSMSAYTGNMLSDLLVAAHATTESYSNLTRDYYHAGRPSQWATLLEAIDPRVATQLVSMIETGVSDGNYNVVNAIQGLGYGLDSALTNLAVYLDASLRAAVTNFMATSDDENQAAYLTSGLNSDEASGSQDLDDAYSDAADDVSDTLDDNEPDFTASYNQNPFDPLVQVEANVRQSVQNALPDFDHLQTDATRVYLYKTEWGPLNLHGSNTRAGGLSDISFDLGGSDPHVPNRLLTTASTIMSWLWNVAAAVFLFMEWRRFLDWLASYKMS